MTGDIDQVSVSGNIDIRNTESNSYVGLLSGFQTAFLSETLTVTQFVAGEVTNVSAKGTISIDGQNFVYVGGLVGKAYNVHFNNASAEVEIQAVSRNFRAYVGGLIGHNFGGILINYAEIVDTVDISIENSYANSVISVASEGTWTSVGGLIGYNQYGIIVNSYAFSEVTLISDDRYYVAGLIGEDWFGTIKNSVATIQVTSTDSLSESESLHVSGLIASINAQSLITNSYFKIHYDGLLKTTAGSIVSSSDLILLTWYQTILTWDDNEVINTAITILSQVDNS
jgi:hypothetical protein